MTALFAVTLSAVTDEAVTVAFATADGTAVEAFDYTAAAGTLTFEPGTTRQTIEVVTLEDDAEESEEGFTVTLSDPSGATLEDATGAGTITDNDGGSGALPEVSIGDAAAVEGGTAEFAVTLRPAAGQAVTVRYRTVDGTAVAGSDYAGTNGTLRFDPGQETRTIRVPALDDDILEDTEDFTVELSDPAGAALADGTATGTITDNDEGKLPALSAGDAAPVVEGGTARIPVTLSAGERSGGDGGVRHGGRQRGGGRGLHRDVRDADFPAGNQAADHRGRDAAGRDRRVGGDVHGAAERRGRRDDRGRHGDGDDHRRRPGGGPARTDDRGTRRRCPRGFRPRSP